MPNPQTCPFCGQANQCAANSPNGCWCFDTAIPPDLLALVPAPEKNKHCICAACVSAFKKDANGFLQAFIKSLKIVE